MKKHRSNTALTADLPTNRPATMPSVATSRSRLSSTALASALSVAVAAMFVAAPQAANAMSLGRATVLSSLGEPLRLEVDIPEISADEMASLKVAVAAPDAFKAAGVEYNAALSSASVSLLRRPDGRSFLRLTSDRVVNEPFVDLIIEANWASGRIVRDYTVLLDPPSFKSAAAPAVVAAATPITAPNVSAAATTPAAKQPDVAPQTQPTQSVAVPVRPAVAKPVPTARPAASAKAAQTARDTVDKVIVKVGDTANSIGQRVKPPGVSLDQMLVAMLRANPDAFIAGNINRLRAGAVIAVPTAKSASEVDTAQASLTLRAQSQDFNAYRRKLASGAPATTLATPDRQATGKVQSEIKDGKAPVASADKLKLAKASAASAAQVDAIAKTRQANEAATRKAELERNLAELNKASASAAAAKAGAAGGVAGGASGVKSGVAPALAAAAVATAAVVAATASKAVMPAPTASLVASAATPTPAVVASATASAAAAASPASAAASTATIAFASAPASASTAIAAVASTVASAAVSPPTKPKPDASPQPPPEPGFIESLTDNPLVPIGLGGALLALIGGLGFKRWRDKKRIAHVDSSFLESRLQPDSFFGASGGQQINTSSSNQGPGSSMVYSPSQIDAAGDVDPVAEADVYLAYGRDLQAEEILKEALRITPQRVAIHAKLLDIYAKRRDVKAFEVLAREMHSICSGQGDEWARVCETGRDLDPQNPMYQGGGAAGAASTAYASPMAAGAAVAAGAVAAASYDSQATMPTSMAAVASHDSDVDLDLDFSLGDDPEPIATPAFPAKGSEPTMSMSAFEPPGAGMDFDLDVSDFGNDAFSAPIPTPPPIKLSLPDLAASDNGLTFSPEPFKPTGPMALAAPAPSPNALNFDLGDLSLDLGGHADAVASVLPEEVSGDPLETKLMLAREFKDIGDSEGARELAREVLGEATGALKTRAQKFLSDLS